MSTVKHSVVGMRGYGHGCAMAGGEKLSATRASVLEEEIGPGKRLKQHRSSQRMQRGPRLARGGTGASGESRGISGGRGRKRRHWQGFRASDIA